MSPDVFLGLPLFSSEVFFSEPHCIFGVASFFIGGLFQRAPLRFFVASFFIRDLLLLSQ
jgi:hypothetical protein